MKLQPIIVLCLSDKRLLYSDFKMCMAQCGNRFSITRVSNFSIIWDPRTGKKFNIIMYFLLLLVLLYCQHWERILFSARSFSDFRTGAKDFSKLKFPHT